MAHKVNLRKIAEEIDALPDEYTAYLNRATGEVYSVGHDDEGEFEEGDEEILDESLPDWRKEELAKAREVLEGDEWIRLPGNFEVHEWSIMRDFADSVTDARLRNELFTAIHGSGAFRYFKDVIHRHGIQQRWFQFKTAAIEDLVAHFLDANEIPYSRKPDDCSET